MSEMEVLERHLGAERSRGFGYRTESRGRLLQPKISIALHANTVDPKVSFAEED